MNLQTPKMMRMMTKTTASTTMPTTETLELASSVKTVVATVVLSSSQTIQRGGAEQEVEHRTGGGLIN